MNLMGHSSSAFRRTGSRSARDSEPHDRRRGLRHWVPGSRPVVLRLRLLVPRPRTCARGIEKLFFVSREGWFLKRVYDELAPVLGCLDFIRVSVRRHDAPFLWRSPRRRITNPWLISWEPSEPCAAILPASSSNREVVDLEPYGFRDVDESIHQQVGSRRRFVRLRRALSALTAPISSVSARRNARRILHILLASNLHRFRAYRACRLGLVRNESACFYPTRSPSGVLTWRSLGCTLLWLKAAARTSPQIPTGIGFVHHFCPDIVGDAPRRFVEFARVIEVLLSAPDTEPASNGRRQRMVRSQSSSQSPAAYRCIRMARRFSEER